MERAADLVAAYGGSLSGEHGDGQAARRAAAQDVRRRDRPRVRTVQGDLRPRRPDEPGQGRGAVPARRQAAAGRRTTTTASPETHFRYPDDDGSFGRAVLRCVGVGKCRRHGGGVMCPSYMATREEEHSTRGRARLLFEMLDGTARGGAIADGWRSDAVRDALDLCLACKGCKADCPVDVDMATYKAEFLSHHYEGRLRPLAHYSMGWLPLWAALAARAPRLVNALAHAGPLGTAGQEGRRRGHPPRCAGLRPRDLPAVVPGAESGQRRVAGRCGAVARHVHQPLPPRHRAGGGRGAGSRRLAGTRTGRHRLLRTDVDLHRPARHRQAGAAAHRRRAAPVHPRGHPGGRAGAQLHGGIPQRRVRAVPRRRGRPAATPTDRHPRPNYCTTTHLAGSRPGWSARR